MMAAVMVGPSVQLLTAQLVAKSVAWTVNRLVDGSVEQRERQMAATKVPMMAETTAAPMAASRAASLDNYLAGCLVDQLALPSAVRTAGQSDVLRETTSAVRLAAPLVASMAVLKAASSVDRWAGR